MRRKGLGRGLSDLLAGNNVPQSRPVVEIPLDEIEPNPLQPRQTIDEDSLDELARSIEAHGVLQPIIVRSTGSGYQIVAGERRWRAAQRAGLRTIPCLVQTADDAQALQLAMIENLQRDDLNPIDAARGYRTLITQFGLTQEELAKRIGKSRPAIANTLRLLELPEDVQEKIRNGKLSEGHARALLPLLGREDFSEILAEIEEKQLSVRETEQIVRERLAPPPIVSTFSTTDFVKTEPRDLPELGRDPHIAAAEQRLQSALATKVVIRPSPKRGGVIHIRYYDNSDLERIVLLLTAHEGTEEI